MCFCGLLVDCKSSYLTVILMYLILAFNNFLNTFNISILLLFLSRTMQKKYATGRPDQKDLNENLAATQGLAHMITECNRLFEVSLAL